MARHQIENPPGHYGTAPEGEIRQEPLPTLRRFSVLIAAAIILPAIAMVVEGFDTGRNWLGAAGVLLISLGVIFFVVLFQMMKSRKIDPSERSPGEPFP